MAALETVPLAQSRASEEPSEDESASHIPVEGPAERHSGARSPVDVHRPAVADPRASKAVRAKSWLGARLSPSGCKGAASGPAPTPNQLSTFQKYFTRPVDLDPEKVYMKENRRFGFRTPGFLLAAGTMLVILLAVIAAAVALTVDRRDHQHQHPSEAGGPVPPAPPPPSNSSPIRVALLDNFPDPCLWYNKGIYYAFATNNAAGILAQPTNYTIYDYGTSNVQIATSSDFVTWELLNATHDPLPVTGTWSTQGLTKTKPHLPKGNVWAPGLLQRPSDNKFVMYYAADKADPQNDTLAATVPAADGRHPPPHCVGAAVSQGLDPAGPYEPLNETLACPVDQGGAIDPAGFQDVDGSLYVVYKVDGNNIGHGGLCGNTKAPIVPTPIMLQKLLSDGTTPSGNAVQLLDRDSSDGPLIEAPDLVRSQEGIYFLFFSSGCTRSPTYDVKYATATQVDGPYVRAKEPLLKTGDYGLLAPGSVGVHGDGDGGWAFAFHARVSVQGMGRIRAMFTSKIVFRGHNATLMRNNSTDSS